MNLTASLFALVVAAAGAVGAGAQVLTKAIEVRSLSSAEASAGREVKLQGTVTFIEGPGAVFFQDETAGSFFQPENLGELRLGDAVEVTGRTKVGNYLPGVARAPYRIIGHGPLPKARSVKHDDLVSGRYHYQRVAIEGIVRSTTPMDTNRSVLRVEVASRIVEVRLDARIEDDNTIVDSLVRIEGLAADGINWQPSARTAVSANP